MLLISRSSTAKMPDELYVSPSIFVIKQSTYIQTGSPDRISMIIIPRDQTSTLYEFIL